MENKNKTPSPKKTDLDLKEKIEISPSKNKLTLKKSPTAVNNSSIQNITTKNCLSIKTSPQKSSPTKKNELFSNMQSNSSPTEKKSPSNSNSQDNSIKKEVNGIINTLPDKENSSHSAQSSKETPFNIDMRKVPSEPSNLWVEKYKPCTTKQIIGQQGEKSCVNKLIVWLKNWHKNHSGNKKLVKPSKLLFTLVCFLTYRK